MTEAEYLSSVIINIKCKYITLKTLLPAISPEIKITDGLGTINISKWAAFLKWKRAIMGTMFQLQPHPYAYLTSRCGVAL